MTWLKGSPPTCLYFNFIFLKRRKHLKWWQFIKQFIPFKKKPTKKIYKTNMMVHFLLPTWASRWDDFMFAIVEYKYQQRPSKTTHLHWIIEHTTGHRTSREKLQLLWRYVIARSWSIVKCVVLPYSWIGRWMLILATALEAVLDGKATTWPCWGRIPGFSKEH